MRVIGWFDNRFFSTITSVAIFLLVMTAIRKISIPKTAPLTSQIRIIEEIRKFIHAPEPVEREAPPREVEKKTIQPRKRVVPEQIETALNKLRESQASREAKAPPELASPSRPRLDLKRPSPRMKKRDSGSRLRMGDRTESRQRLTMPGEERDRNVIEIAAGSSVDEVSTGDPALRGFIESGKEGPGGGGEDEVIRIAIAPWTGSRQGGEVIYGVMEPLIAWMKENPADFSAVERKFLRYEGGDLISRALFFLEDETGEETRYELLLLFKSSISELRICLIEGNEATQLIDKGLQERSNYLRTGVVAYSGPEKISIQSTQRVPGQEATRRFYQIFLSWWTRTREG